MTVAAALLLSMGLKAIVDVDRHWDTWAYHLPFAARLWGMVPPQDYVFNKYFEARFDGFAVLGEYLQGFFWALSGRPEATNLLGYFSLLAFLWFLKRYLAVPIYLSTIALLAIPLVQIHATTSYIDLPGGLAAAVAILMTYLLFVSDTRPKWDQILVLLLGAAVAANMRLQLIPIVFAVLAFAVPKMVLSYARDERFGIGLHRQWKILLASLALCMALAVVGATALRNTLLYGNPVYPVRVSLGTVTLNHTEEPPEEPVISGKDLSRPERWLYSVFEVVPRPFFRRDWSIDQASPPDVDGAEFGGFFGAYVAAHLVLLGYLTYRTRSRRGNVAVLAVVLMSALSALMPSASRLRYYMYWMIVLVSLNLSLVCYFAKAGLLPKRLNARTVALASGAALAIVVISTRAEHIRPLFYSFDQFMERKVDPTILAQIHDGESVCLYLPQSQFNFLYASIFHPPKHYSIMTAFPQDCGARKIITK
jgi:hypothetical protein